MVSHVTNHVISHVTDIIYPTGLRGAVAFALAQNLQEYFTKEVTGYLVTTTLVIVLFTIVILGGSTQPLLKVIQ